MRIWMLAVAVCFLLPRAASGDATDDARARWGEDLRDIILMFDFPSDSAAWGDDSLQQNAELDCTEVSPDDVYRLAIGNMTSACTASIPTSDQAECRVTAINEILMHRWKQLERGDDSGFTFEVTCEGYVITGEVHPYHPNGYGAANGLISAEQTDSGGGTYGSYHHQVTWEKLPPDVADPTQWRDAVLVPVWRTELVIARLQRAIKEGNAEDAESWRDYLATDRAVRALADVEAFPELPDDDSVRTAAIEWLTKVQADADHGDQKLLVDRMSHGKKQKKAYKRKTAAIAKRWKKASVKRTRARDHVVKAFDAAHAQE